jgi:hypothetical protein
MTIATNLLATASPTDRLAVIDALYRYAAGLDDDDTAMLESALTEDAAVDLTSAVTKLGMEFPVLEPREVVVSTLLAAVGPLDTSHSLSNLRVQVDGDRAEVRCYAQAQHFLPGVGPDPAHLRHALMMNRYDAALRRDGSDWRIARLNIDLVWFDGDPAVLVSQVS